MSVQDGEVVGAAFVYLNAVIEDARVVDQEGRPWSGILEVGAAGGEVSAVDGARLQIEGRALLTSSPLTALGFQTGLPGDGGSLIVTLAVLLFAVSTAISWSYYGDRATEYLFGPGAVRYYRWAYIGFFFLGSLLPLQTVWDFGDVALGLMALPNLLTLVLLAGPTAKMTREYFSRTHTPYR